MREYAREFLRTPETLLAADAIIVAAFGFMELSFLFIGLASMGALAGPRESAFASAADLTGARDD